MRSEFGDVRHDPKCVHVKERTRPHSETNPVETAVWNVAARLAYTAGAVRSDFRQN